MLPLARALLAAVVVAASAPSSFAQYGPPTRTGAPAPTPAPQRERDERSLGLSHSVYHPHIPHGVVHSAPPSYRVSSSPRFNSTSVVHAPLSSSGQSFGRGAARAVAAGAAAAGAAAAGAAKRKR